MRYFGIAYILVIWISLCTSCQFRKPLEGLDLNELTITGIHSAYRNGRYSCEQLVTAYIQHIHQYDSQINSITIINPEAIAIAKALDEEYKRTKKLRPLHGIPVIVKDNIHTRGLTTTAGSLALQHFIPAGNAFIVDRLVDAGAVILAKSNMAEWAFTPWGSFSSTRGATSNAYNPAYSAGGSSGGTGASIASNFGVIGLGTDTGGSIRLPSSHGALVGIRPTMGLVSNSGIVPCEPRNDMAGPMCRTVEDAVRTLEIIAGQDSNDKLTSYSEGKIPNNYVQFLQADGLKGARIGILREIIEMEPDPEILDLFEKAIVDMKAMGVQIVDPVSIPDFSQLSSNHWCDNFKDDIENYLRVYVNNDTLSTLSDIIRIGSRSAFTREQLTFYATHSGRPDNPGVACLDAYSDQRRIAFRSAIENYMDSLKLDALVYPTWNIKPYRMDSIVEEYIGDNTGVVAPHTGQPAFTVPMGFMKGNLPTGLEFLGRMYSEPTLIRLVYSYEQGTRHRIPPVPLLEKH